MGVFALVAESAASAGLRRPSPRAAVLAAALCLATAGARAEPQSTPPAPEARVIVRGEASVSLPPDYAQIRSGVTTRAKTVREATDANSKLMSAVTAALIDAGVAPKDMQTSHFSIQPVYVQPEPRGEAKLAGYSVSNQLTVTIRQIAKLGDIIERLVAAGVTDVGNVTFLVADASKQLDQVREAAVADARRKAELYARASGVTLGPVAWITEDSASPPPLPAPYAAKGRIAAVPISAGEDTLHAHITVGFDIAR